MKHTDDWRKTFEALESEALASDQDDFRRRCRRVRENIDWLESAGALPQALKLANREHELLRVEQQRLKRRSVKRRRR